MGSERRSSIRYATHIEVDYKNGDNFLFSYIENISEMGIFIYSENPLPVGSELELKFGPEGEPPLELAGVVAWVNPVRASQNLNPGMGVRFSELTDEQRDRVVDLVRTIAYLGKKNPKLMN